jgi:1-acyl-sn-glycerol-3-phosphate acyltransferase
VRTLLDWFGTLLFVPAFAVTMLFFDVVQRLALLVSRGAHDRALLALQWTLARLCLPLFGLRASVEGADALPPPPCIFVANHQAMFDMPLFAAAAGRHHLKYVAKKELASGMPSISIAVRRGGFAAIDRKNRVQAVEAIRAMGAEAERRRVSVLIFPEGTRAWDGRLKPFKPAGTLALLETMPDAPVVPLAIDGMWRVVARRLKPLPWGERVRVRFCPALPRSTGEDREGLLRRAEAEVAATIASWRGAEPGA